MRTRYSLIAALVAAGVAIALFLLLGSPEPGADSPASVAGLTAAEAAAAREAKDRLARIPSAPARSGAGKFSARTIAAAEDQFRRMLAVRGLITQEKERRARAQNVLAMPDGVDLMRGILLDPALARAAFGNFQAEARFYATAVLEEMARQGNLDFVVGVASELGAQLAAVTGEIDRGRAEDLRGLASVIGRSLGSRGLADARSPVLAKLGFGPGLPRPVHELYVEGMFYGVWKAESIEQAMVAVKTL